MNIIFYIQIQLRVCETSLCRNKYNFNIIYSQHNLKLYIVHNFTYAPHAFATDPHYHIPAIRLTHAACPLMTQTLPHIHINPSLQQIKCLPHASTPHNTFQPLLLSHGHSTCYIPLPLPHASSPCQIPYPLAYAPIPTTFTPPLYSFLTWPKTCFYFTYEIFGHVT